MNKTYGLKEGSAKQKHHLEIMIKYIQEETVKLLNSRKSIVAKLKNKHQNKRLAAYQRQDAHCSQELTIKRCKIINKKINKLHPQQRFQSI